MGRTSVFLRGLRSTVFLVVLSVTLNALAQTTAAPTLTLTTINGQKIRLSDLRGKIVLINFWATSCAICQAKMPELVQSYQKYHQRGLEVIAIAMSYDEFNLIKEYVKKNDLLFPVVWDSSGDIGRSFGGIIGTPTTFIVDKKGRLISKTIGPIDFDKLRRYLDKVLGRNTQ